MVEFNETTSVRQQLEAISSTGVFVSVHTSNLANAQFLRPGSAVLEVIQRNWAHHDLDKSFHVRAFCLSASLSCPQPCAARLEMPAVPVEADKEPKKANGGISDVRRSSGIAHNV